MTQPPETTTTQTANDDLLAAMVAQVERENEEHVEEEATGPVIPFPTVL